ncbi:MAG TPA: C13 family peptidase [Caulobacteraceae bacterium]|nr:C13 family peptidase [Caulobacteraceae bacterium]
MALAAPARAASFANWAAVVVSGDDEAAHADIHTEAFDNARRDVAAALERRGFSPANLAQFSVEPALHPRTAPKAADLPAIARTLSVLARRAPAGCLVYFTSHGAPQGAVLADRLLAPPALARAIDRACPGRPVVAVISACFSGVFVPALAGPDRLVVTAARRDRPSFGCGESDRYPYFDACVLASFPASADFLALARRARACVADKERETGAEPPSDPQIFVGARLSLPTFQDAARNPLSRRGTQQ